MKTLKLLALLCFPLPALAASIAPLQLLPNTSIHWATQDEGKNLMARPDAFTKTLSSFDRAVRLQQAEPSSPEAFLEYVSDQARAWTEDEAQRFRVSLESIQARLERWKLPLPDKVFLIKTTGKDEPAPYTRQNAIILPESVVRSAGKPNGLLAHELFHVLSRHATTEFRSALYGVLGFKHCGPVSLPPDIANRRITNPDSPLYTHYIQVQHEGVSKNVIPILLSESSQFNPSNPKPFFAYLEQKLMVVKQDASLWKAATLNGQSRLLEMDAVDQFFDQIGGRRYSVFQPEEILARHFTSLVLNVTLPAEQTVQSKLDRVLLTAGKSEN